MKRRNFIKGSVSSAAILPFAARAQQPRILPTVGYLGAAGSVHGAGTIAFVKGLNEAGFIDGRSVSIEFRFADNQYDQLPSLPADLVQRQVSAIATAGVPSTMAAKSATSTIPIIFYVAGDPVEMKFVASLDRPGGNLTGIVNLSVELERQALVCS